MQKVFRYPKTWKHRRFPHDVFRHCETKKFRQNRDTPIIQTFFDSKTVMKHKVPPTKNFGTVRQKTFRRKNVTPLLLSIIFFHTRSFLEHRRVPHEIFPQCEATIFSRKISIPTIMQKNFSRPQIY